MPDKSSPSWQDIIWAAAGMLENRYNIKLVMDECILLEINQMIDEGIAGFGFKPNVAKIAGLAAFWIRRLKPASISLASPNYYRAVNEELALLVALAIANLYQDSQGLRKKIVLPPGELQDLAKDLRYHSHTPHSLIMLFELLLDAKIISIPAKGKQ